MLDQLKEFVSKYYVGKSACCGANTEAFIVIRRECNAILSWKCEEDTV